MTNSLPTWIERLLGLSSGPGEGAAWRLEHAWPWPSWLTVLLIGLGAALIVVSYLRENPQATRPFRLALAGLRLTLLGLVLLMLAQWSLRLERTGLPNLALLLDDSLSMETVDRYEEGRQGALQDRSRAAGFAHLSRWNLARAILLEDGARRLTQLQEHYQLGCYYLSDPRTAVRGDAREIADALRAHAAVAERSRLGSAVRGVLDDLRGSPPAAVVVLTDGLNNEGPSLVEASNEARRRGVPLYFVGLGDARPVRDLRLADLLVDDVVFVDDLVSFEAKLTGQGFEGREVDVVLRESGRASALASVQATVGPDGRSQAVRLVYRPREEGTFRFVVEVSPQDGEQRTDNNRQEKVVRVRKERIRVLLVQGYPNYEYRYLRNMLARDPTIQLSAVLQDADLEYAEQDSAALAGFPVRREELFQYDVVILGDADPSALSGSMLENLAEFVRQPGKGGALVLICGPRHLPLAYRTTPLAGLLPIDLASARSVAPGQGNTRGFRAQPTELGLSRPAMQLGSTAAESRAVWGRLAPLYWMLESEPRPAAQVLAESEPLGPQGRQWPLILMQYVGAGKVLMHATDETWRWRIGMGDVYFARYWVQSLRHLAPSKLFAGDRRAVLSTDRDEYARGEPVVLRLRFLDDRLAPPEAEEVTVVVQSEGRQDRRVSLRRSTGRGAFEALLADPPLGESRAWLATPSLPGPAPAVNFRIIAPQESQGLPMNAAELRLAAERSRGQFYAAADADRLLDDLPEGRPVPIETLPPRPLWNRWPLLALFLSLLTAEWLLRKRGGMI